MTRGPSTRAGTTGTGRGGRFGVTEAETIGPAVPVPADLGAGGISLWSSVTEVYELEEHEAALLLEAARTRDVIDALCDVLAADGVISESSQGSRAHPAAVEARQQRITLARLLAAMRLPTEEEGDQQANARPQRRAARGVYAVG